MTRMVVKVWDDKGYETTVRNRCQVTLLQNGTAYETKTLSEANSWQYTWGEPAEVRQKRQGDHMDESASLAVSGYVSALARMGLHSF